MSAALVSSAEAGFVFDPLMFGNGFETTVATSQMVENTGTLGSPRYTYATGPGLTVNPLVLPATSDQWSFYGFVNVVNQGAANATIPSNYLFGPSAPPATHELGMRITFDVDVFTFASSVNVELGEDRLVEIFDTGGGLIDSYLLTTAEFGGGIQFFGYEGQTAIGAVHVSEPNFDGVFVPTLYTEIQFSDSLPGDLNGDGAIDGADLAILLSSWGACGACVADLNGDGMVDGADLAELLASWSGS